jgi:hypothetical protein
MIDGLVNVRIVDPRISAELKMTQTSVVALRGCPVITAAMK